MPFSAAVRTPGFEVVNLAELRDRRARHPDRLHRLEFHTLSLVTAGRGRREVDFDSCAAVPGTFLWVRPGQVQRFDRDDTTQGWHVLFTADFVSPVVQVSGLLDTWVPTSVRQTSIGSEQNARLVRLCEQLALEGGNGHPDAGVLQLLLAALLLAAEHGSPVSARTGGADQVHARFRRLLEQRFASDRSVESYAALVGCSPRTLTRACHAAVGSSAKDVVDDRVALEARRLLAHTDLTVAAVGRRLGFEETTNFVKFFVRRTGTTPGTFRQDATTPRG
ncbi:AraC family transcriptional regulator [Kineococcus endophyticus]|uniref:AraC family transcriptional regulator n=1 Tax=Kineococcus endophyticus TaxID=1181883 RepID=A0ABV3P2B5_9ACTN